MDLKKLFIASMVAFSMSAIADTTGSYTMNGIEWTYSNRDDVAKTITLGGDGATTTEPKRAIGADTIVDAATIPWMFKIGDEMYKVVRIGNYAFYKCTGLYGTITIPNHVTEIGKSAFNTVGSNDGNLYISSLGGVTNINSYVFENAKLNQGFPNLSRVTTYALNTFQNVPFTGAARISPLTSRLNNYFFLNSKNMAGVFCPGPATVTSGFQKNTIVGCAGFAKGATSCKVIFAGINTKTENKLAGTMLDGVEDCTVFVPASTHWDGLVTGGVNNKVIYYGVSTNLDIVVNDDAKTITATPTDEIALADILSSAPILKEVFGWNTYINVTNTIEVAADTITAEMLSEVSFNSMLMTFKVKTQAQLDSVLAAVPQTSMLAIDATEAKVELVIPSDRALWVWLGGTGKYIPHINGLTISFR